MERFLTSSIPVYSMIVITILGIIGTCATDIYYRQMISQTENMMNVHHAFLLQMKNKFENTYRINKGVNNISLFVKRQLKENRFLGISSERIGKASQKAALLCLIFGGAITLLQWMNGFEWRQVVMFLGITLFCSGAGFCVYILSDMDYIQEKLQIQLEDYFVNTLTNRLLHLREDETLLSKTDGLAENVRTENGRRDSSRVEKNRIEGRRRKSSLSENLFLDSQEKRTTESELSEEKNGADESRFTEEDIQYIRQSLERIAAGRDRNIGNEKKNHFSSKEEKIIDDILKEYFV
jgi:hypothetical protein